MSKSRQHEFSQALYDIIYHALINQGVNKEQAAAIAEESTDTVLDEFGGENLYIPKNISGKAARRNRTIYEEFTGDNHDELAKKYGVTLQRIYTIIKEQRQFELSSRQFCLWDDQDKNNT
ncbi:Mor transcription activator family protein [Moraxella cuniculi DSM 21768]|uniref:Mor transcription activator family protein n=1 Tax=Moraxella cuniculi DSM 21768 TaxID=1122245 RepID=A0A1N7DI17_9GAMM|nr:Mor transcription activator family protein [Moraxella cuniculi]OOS08074.1 hypothetical protein B0189_01705 [Moraxella cuniculi]SIR75441.1 Mor transcription activator family protein [Moraxella cuniculi DSM 21768]